ncbi:MAG: sigma 54-interacting transcriptional regulator [Myxococcales bacterium]|nr:sigma 54-interacting transcriptional regulator [Myxococcales bacterium]
MLEQLRLLTTGDRQALLLSAKEVAAAPGTALVREGTTQPGLIMLVEGSASVQIAEGGECRTVAHIGPGECIGEISLLSGQTTTANVILDVPGRYLCIPPARLKAVLDADPAMTGRFYGSLALIVAERLAERNRAEGGPDPLGFVDRIAASWTKRGVEAQRGGHLGLIGDSPVMRELYAAIDRVAAGDWTALIRGETGSGKELVARAIHEASKRRGGPFVAVNCAGLTDTLLSSQLFGHVKGAFTGATRDQPGLFEAASGGTIFLDEIGDISLATQRSLLRVLQEREVIRVGEAQTRKVDTRVLAATHRDLEAMTRTGDFREDLLYRIRIARINVPPLRARLCDVPALAAGFLRDTRVTGGKAVRGIAPAALDRLRRYAWPGNVRELKAALEHAVIHTSRELLGVDDLPPELLERPTPATSSAPADGAAVDRPGLVSVARGGNDRAAIIEALRLARGNRSEAARLLGIGRATFYRWLKTHAIDVDALDLSE